MPIGAHLQATIYAIAEKVILLSKFAFYSINVFPL